MNLATELLAEANLPSGGEEGLVRKVFGDLAYRSEPLEEDLWPPRPGSLLVTERAERRGGVSQQVEIAFSSPKRVFGLGRTLATSLAWGWPPGSRPR